MLLEALKTQISSQIASVEAQIATLQQQLLDLQSHAQQIQSVEQACESAIAQIRTANTMIQAIAPDQVAVFKAAIDAEFTQPLGQLTAATDEPDDAQDPTPEEPMAPETITVDVEVVAAEPDHYTNGNGNGHNGNGHNGDSNSHQPLDFSKLNWVKLRKLAAIKGINGKNMKRTEIEAALQETDITQDHIDTHVG